MRSELGGRLIGKSPKFQVEVQVAGNGGRLLVSGDLDMATAPHLEGAVREALELGARRITIDLGAVKFVDSSGLRVLIVVHRQAQEEGWNLAIRRPSAGAFTVFQVSGADVALPFVGA